LPSFLELDFEVKLYTQFLLENLDKYWRCKNLDELIEKSRDNFKANGYKEEEMRQILPLLIGFSGH
jgi:hypothetical protein